MTIRDALRAAVSRLRAGGVDTPELDARVLAEEAFALSHAGLLAASSQSAAPEAVVAFDAMIARRLAGEPVARLLGRREFWGLDFTLSSATLVPRPDSETIVEAALAEAGPRDRPLRALDLGVGTGCLLLAILSERPNATGLGVDRAFEAAATAQANARTLGLADRARFVVGDWAAAVGGAFDLVVSNPPYITTGDMGGLDVEVREHDPHLALDGGPDGLDAYATIARAAPALLMPGGVLVLELGQGQGPAVTALVQAAGLAVTRIAPDLGGVDRALVARRP